MKRFGHIHSSSRFDRSPKSLRDAATKYVNRAHLITFTEVERESREDALRQVGRKFDYGVITGDHGNANDCGIMFSKKRFKLIYSEHFKISNRRIFLPSGAPRELPYATAAVLHDKENNKNIVVCVAHFASSVEVPLARKVNTRRTLQWNQAVRKTTRRANRLAKKHKAKGRLVVADWNVNLKRPWVKTLIKSIAPAYQNTWKKTSIKGGTHGNRIIDFSIIRGKLKVKGTARPMRDDNSSDHRPFFQVIVWK